MLVFMRIFQRRLYSIYHPIRLKPMGNDPNKRLLFKKNVNSTLKTISRNYYTAYDADGKTVGTVLNKVGAEELLVLTYTSNSFTLTCGPELIGSLILFPHALLSWNISSAKDITEESLILFKLIEPKIDILVFGYGNSSDYTPEVRANFTKCCKNLGIRFEALPTKHAVGTFNFLASERRLVAAALIPPSVIDVLQFDRKKPVLLEDGEEDEEDEEVKSIEEGTTKKTLIK